MSHSIFYLLSGAIFSVFMLFATTVHVLADEVSADQNPTALDCQVGLGDWLPGAVTIQDDTDRTQTRSNETTNAVDTVNPCTIV